MITEYTQEEYEKQTSSYKQYIDTFVSEFTSTLYTDGIITEIETTQLQKYLASPDMFKEEINNLVEYFYVSNGETRQLFEMVESLPTLNYKLETFSKDEKSSEYSSLIHKTMNRIKHKRLTRDLLKQNAATGNVIGMWIGNKNNLYPYIFDDTETVFPSSRFENGDWICVMDMSRFDMMSPFQIQNEIANLNPYITTADYNAYRKDMSNPTRRYVRLPQDRTFVLRTGVLKRNQALGTSWASSGLYDILHKKKMKDVEQSVANKVLNAIAVLTIGNEKKENSTIPKPIKGKIVQGVKSALEHKKSKGSVPFVALPEYTDLKFPEMKVSGLDGKQFDTVNKDIQTAFGISGSLTSGTGGNHASAKANLETVYKRIAVMIEDVESEVFQKMINLIVPAKQRDNFRVDYDKEAPLTLKEKVDILIKMNDKGWSTKHVIDHIPGISFESYLEQTQYETNELELQKIITPYRTSYTMTDGEAGRPEIESDNENSIKTKTNDGNSIDY